jgi:Zn finger protein HypA/HybF involved in hydrogenase expression
MSADNFVGVRPNDDDTYSVFEYGNMSVYGEDCMYLNDQVGEVKSSRQEALMYAHDLVNEMDICEYGVIEMNKKAKEPCGRCWVCVHERHIVATDLPKCDGCGEAISHGEWMVMVHTGTYHNRCEPGRTTHANV